MVCLAVVLPEHEDLRIVACVFLVSWSRILAPARRCKICCRYLGLEQIPQHSYTICLTAFWSRSGAPALTCTICCLWCQHEDVRFRVGVLVCCRYLCLEKVPQHSYSHFVDGVFVSKWCFSIEMYDLLPLCVELVPQHEDVRFLVCVLVYCRCLGLEVGAEARFVGAMPQHSDV